MLCITAKNADFLIKNYRLPTQAKKIFNGLAAAKAL